MVDLLVVEFSASARSDLDIAALTATSDGGAIALGAGAVWRLRPDGHAQKLTEGPDQYARIVTDRQDTPIALATWGEIKFFSGTTWRPVDEREFHELRWSQERQLLVVFAGVHLRIFTPKGELVSGYEFTKAINDVAWLEDGLVVAAAQPQFFDVIAQ